MERRELRTSVTTRLVRAARRPMVGAAVLGAVGRALVWGGAGAVMCVGAGKLLAAGGAGAIGTVVAGVARAGDSGGGDRYVRSGGGPLGETPPARDGGRKALERGDRTDRGSGQAGGPSPRRDAGASAEPKAGRAG